MVSLNFILILARFYLHVKHCPREVTISDHEKSPRTTWGRRAFHHLAWYPTGLLVFKNANALLLDQIEQLILGHIHLIIGILVE
jgi:hypothetical protein